MALLGVLLFGVQKSAEGTMLELEEEEEVIM